MIAQKFNYLQTFWQLMLCNFYIFKPRILDQMINGLIWASINILVFGHIMTARGMSAQYGPFILVSITAIQGFFTPANNVIILVSDITNPGSNLHYELTLPTPQWTIFLKYALANAYQGFMTTVLMLPLGKLLLGDTFSLQHFSFFKFYFIVMLTCLFGGFFTLLLASKIYNFLNISNMWQRIIFPLWFLAGFQFCWHDLYQISPKIAYLNLLNPLTYAFEGARAAALDPALSLNYWHCVVMLMLFTTIFGWIGIMNLKKRLDCV
jgi:ABC-type polysaccharide/polyol phosphate export permease